MRRGLHRAGLERRRRPNVADVLRHRGIATVLDVGANDGGFAAELRERGYRGRIVSFEPIAAIHARLAARAARDPLWQAERLALGETEGEREIAVAEADIFSSFKPLTDYSSGLWSIAREQRREMVPVRRLDRLLDERPELGAAACLKVDTQGFEMEVLRGAGDRLRQFALIQLELALTPLYQDQPDWMETVRWMAERGFTVMLAKENGVDWQAMRVVELDVLFERIGDPTRR